MMDTITEFTTDAQATEHKKSHTCISNYIHIFRGASLLIYYGLNHISLALHIYYVSQNWVMIASDNGLSAMVSGSAPSCHLTNDYFSLITAQGTEFNDKNG